LLKLLYLKFKLKDFLNINNSLIKQKLQYTHSDYHSTMKLLKYLVYGLASLICSGVHKINNNVSALVSPVVNVNPLPIVLMHGILSDTTKMEPVADWLHKNTGGALVIPIEIGNGKQDSVALTMPDQLTRFCQSIRDNSPVLAGGFNLIGISQGGLLARGYVQKCADFPVRNLITWVTPHGGVYPYPDPLIYTDAAQSKNSYPGYWRDPYQYNNYLTQSAYLADLNNENPGPYSTLYRDRLLSLENLVLIWSAVDDVLEPPASGRFATFAINRRPIEVISAEFTTMWKGLGLDVMNSTNRLKFYETNCKHADHVTLDCLEAWKHYTLPYLV
jgi:palmitoyl-protein thioesterase